VLLHGRLGGIQPVPAAQVIFQAFRENDIIDAKANDGDVLAGCPVHLHLHLRRFIRGSRKYQQEDMAGVDGVHQRGSILDPGKNVPRGDPTAQPARLQCRADRLSYLIVVGGITDEDFVDDASPASSTRNATTIQCEMDDHWSSLFFYHNILFQYWMSRGRRRREFFNSLFT
jgi:hypothetical protein